MKIYCGESGYARNANTRTGHNLMSYIRRSPAVLVPIIAALIIVGCSMFSDRPNSSAEAIKLTTARSAYHPGDTTLAVLSNQTDGRVWYNLCFSDLERRTADDWSFVIGPLPPSNPETGSFEACQTIAHALSPDTTSHLHFPLPDTLSEGTYRITTNVEVEARGNRTRKSDERRTLVTDPFIVEIR